VLVRFASLNFSAKEDPVPNRLQGETSPYLLQHADNPVDWYPWGEQALQAAADQDKPIFLSIGYAACHWCHVMEHESFKDPDTAAIMNEYFINIKVDREERPDLDSIYMNAVVAMTGQGGWPMSVFLTPDGEPFFGGTYFPPAQRHNLPSFRQVLQYLAREWQENRERLLQAGAELSEHLRQTPSLLDAQDALSEAKLQNAAQALFENYDWQRGGWGGAPKFPQATTIEFLLQKAEREGDKLAGEMAAHSLRHMAAGGIYDHIGGGFHRYAVDAAWLVPHFEKMLYDNALLLRVYLHAWQMTGESVFRDVVEEIIDFLQREMRHPQGGFYSAIDADSEGEEGKFYLWSVEEIRSLLHDKDVFDRFAEAFGVTEEGDYEGRNILHRQVEAGKPPDVSEAEVEALGDGFKDARQRLLAARQERVRPETDDKILTCWNGLTLTALAEVVYALDREDLLPLAQDLAGFMLQELIQDGELKRSWREGRARYTAYLEDHAALGLGLLALYQVDFDPRWYEAAKRQAEVVLDHFVDPEGGFFDTRDDHERLVARPKSLQDSPTPSGNTLAAELLLRLAAFSGDARFEEAALASLRGMINTAVRHPTAFAGWLNTAMLALGPRWQVAIVGSAEDEDVRAFLNVLQGEYMPRWAIAVGSKPPPTLLDGRKKIDGSATAYLCQDFTCQLPTDDLTTFEAQIADAKQTGAAAE
jgi:hypothetical protein